MNINGTTKGKVRLPLPFLPARVRVHVSAPGLVTLLDGDGIASYGDRQFVRELKVQQGELTIDPGKDTCTYWITLKPLQLGEPHDYEPVPQRPKKSTLLGRMRERVRLSKGGAREVFDNEGAFPGYELDDDDPGLFEEEIIEAAEEARMEAQLAKTRPPIDPEPESKPGTPETPEAEGDS